MVQFLLNQKPTRIEGERADVTVLEYLRTRQNLCGTKEGCASGDCGACTVVYASVVDGTLEYSAVNSCLAFVGTLHGKQLITVEHLATTGGLHPVQQALVDHHGSQCGFCTPGFVMSLLALWKREGGDARERQAIDEYLSGNLCRCTGYRPIISAAQAACADQCPDHFSEHAAGTMRALDQIGDPPPGQMLAGTLYMPTSATDLADVLAEQPGARLVAGGTDLALEVTQQLRPADKLVYLGRVRELLSITDHARHVGIGAAVSYSRCYPLLRPLYPDFAAMLLRLGSRQIRNQGTLGGNIGNASPIGDTPPVLIALRASITLQSRHGSREMLLEEYFLDYKKTALQAGEFIRDIRLPKPLPGYQLKVYKVSKRHDDDISAVLMAIWIKLAGDRVKDIVIACGGMAAIPQRARACEAALLGEVFDRETIHAARDAIGTDFSPIGDVRASARYREQVVGNLLLRLHVELTGHVAQVSHHG